MMPRIQELAAEIEATTDEMLAACEAFKAEVSARRSTARRHSPDCSKAEWALLRRLDRLWAKRRSALREQRDLLEAEDDEAAVHAAPLRQHEPEPVAAV